MRFWPRRRDKTPQQPLVRWLSESESPFGVSVLDCRPCTQNLVAGTASQEIAARFVQLRTWIGEELDDYQVANVVPTPSGLRYPFDGAAQPDGPVFKASVMEEKWDVYLRVGRLYFVRSWTGDPSYIAQSSWSTDEWAITQVWQADAVPVDAQRSVQVVDFLIKSHLYNLAAPHPLLRSLRGDDQALALASFSEFGVRALYGTFDDLIHCATLEKALWGYREGKLTSACLQFPCAIEPGIGARYSADSRKALANQA